MNTQHPLTEPGQLEILVSKLVDGLVVLDPEGKIQFANPSAKRMLEGLTEDIIGYQLGRPTHEVSNEFRVPINGQVHVLETRASEIEWQGENAWLVSLRDITQQKKVEENLKHSKERFHQLFTHSISGFALHEIILDSNNRPIDYRFLEVNQAFEDLTGLKIEDVLGKCVSEVLPEILETDLVERYGEAALTGRSARFEFYSEPLQKHYQISVYSPQKGQFATLFTDLTTRVEAEATLKAKEEKYHTLFEMMNEGVVYQNAQGEILSANPTAERILGVNLDQMQGKTSLDPNWRSIHLDGTPLPGEDHPAMVALRTGKKVEDYIFGVFHPQKKQTVWINVSAVPLFQEEEQEPYQVFTTFTDITDRIQAENDLRERVKELNCISGVSSLLQKETSLDIIGPRTIAMLIEAMQYPEITAVMIKVGNFSASSDRWKDRTNQTLEKLIRVDGKVISQVAVSYTENQSFLLPEEQFLIDRIAEQLGLWYEKQTNLQKLREGRERLQMAVEGADLCIWDWNIQSDEVTYTENLVSSLGYEAEDIEDIQKFWESLMHPDDYPKVMSVLETTLAGKNSLYQAEYRVHAKDGSWSYILDTGKVVDRGPKNQPLRFVGVHVDITALSLAKKSLSHQEERYRSLFYATGVALAAVNQDSIITMCNQQFLDLVSLTREKIINKKSWLDFISLEDLDRVQKLERTFSADSKHQSSHTEFVLLDSQKKSKHIWAHFSQDPVSGNNILSLADISDRVQAEQERTQYHKRINALREASLAVTSSLELDKVLDAITHQIEQVVPCKTISVQLLRGRNLEIIACHGFKHPDKVLGLVFPLGGDYPNQTVIDSNQPFTHSNISEIYPHFHSAQDEYQSGQIQSWLGVPLLYRGKAIGMISVDREKISPFSDADIETALEFANQAAIAITNAQLHELSQKQIGQLETLRKIDKAITSSLDIQISSNVILQQIVNSLQVDAAAILLYDEYLQELTHINEVGFKTTAPFSTPIPLGLGYAGKASLDQKLFFVPDIQQAELKPFLSATYNKEGFVSYFGLPLISKGKLIGLLELFHRTQLTPESAWRDFAKNLAQQTAIAIDSAASYQQLQQANQDLILAYNATIEGWAQALEYRDSETQDHSRRVVNLTMKIAQQMEIPSDKLEHIYRGALLHDIGKMGIPDSILHKPGPLSDEEWEIMRRHPSYSVDILKKVAFLAPAQEIPHYHHERWDGTGYPEGLQGREIPLAARIFAIVDVWDALRSDRPYRKAWSEQKTRQHIKDQAGKHFDPEVVEIFFQIINSESTE